jgi:hypothetical protein
MKGKHRQRYANAIQSAYSFGLGRKTVLANENRDLWWRKKNLKKKNLQAEEL